MKDHQNAATEDAPEPNTKGTRIGDNIEAIHKEDNASEG